MAEVATKRRRVQRSPTPEYKLDDDDDSYVPYVPVAQRRQAKLAKLTSWGANADKDKAKQQQQEQDEKEDEEREEELRREKARKERTLLMEAQEVHSRKAVEGTWMQSGYFKCVTELESVRFEEDSRRKGRRARCRDSCCYCQQTKAGLRSRVG